MASTPRFLPEPAAGVRVDAFVLVQRAAKDRYGERWRVRCDCGAERVISLASLRQRMRKGKRVQCADCFHREWSARGCARRAGLGNSVRRFGFAEAMGSVEEWGDPVELLPELW